MKYTVSLRESERFLESPTWDFLQSDDPEWKQFQDLVGRMRQSLAAPGVSVTSPDKLADVFTGKLVNVDATIRYQSGDVPITVLLECRKRGRAAGTQWIDEIASRKKRLNCVRAIAVSSAGFTSEAFKLAPFLGVETHRLLQLSDSEIESWMKPTLIGLEPSMRMQLHAVKAVTADERELNLFQESEKQTDWLSGFEFRKLIQSSIVEEEVSSIYDFVREATPRKAELRMEPNFVLPRKSYHGVLKFEKPLPFLLHESAPRMPIKALDILATIEEFAQIVPSRLIKRDRLSNEKDQLLVERDVAEYLYEASGMWVVVEYDAVPTSLSGRTDV